MGYFMNGNGGIADETLLIVEDEKMIRQGIACHGEAQQCGDIGDSGVQKWAGSA